MKQRKLFAFTIALLALGGGAAVANSGHMSKTSAVPKAEVDFDPAAWMLSESDKSALKKLVQDAQTQGAIRQITVAAWSDKALPKQGQKLGDKDRELADKRTASIRDYLKSQMDGLKVDSYNMAESSNWLARLFNTRDAELKSAFGRAGAEKPVTHEEFLVIKRIGGASKGIAVVEFQQDKASSDQESVMDR